MSVVDPTSPYGLFEWLTSRVVKTVSLGKLNNASDAFNALITSGWIPDGQMVVLI